MVPDSDSLERQKKKQNLKNKLVPIYYTTIKKLIIRHKLNQMSDSDSLET